jgi:hypothetical protein
MFISRRWFPGLLALTIAGVCLGEEPSEPAKFYKFDFVIKELAGAKILNSRAYSALVSTGKSTAEIRAGSKIPYDAGANNYQQIDVGVSIDLRAVKEVQDRLAFFIAAEVSSVPEGSPEGRPTVRQNKWHSDVIVPLKKPTLLFSSENLDAKTQMQVEVTAAPIP